MKKVFIVFLITWCTAVYAKTYYVATPQNGGNDTYDGLASTHLSGLHGPWASWEKAFTSVSVQPGDTVFIRGGIYYTTVVTGTGLQLTRNGSSENWIVYINYPGETPIMDCSNITAEDIVYSGLRNDGISTNGVSFVKLIGLTIRNVKQYYNRNYARGIYLRDGIVTLENCTAYNCWGHGIHSQHNSGESSIHTIINCDSYNNCDSISGDPLGSNAGATGAGFNAWAVATTGKTYFTNCRAWGNSDQGFSIGSDSYVKAEGCWSFANKAYVSGGGAGFKEGWQDIDVSFLRREMINCVAAFNDGYGFFTNEKGSGDAPDWNAVRSNHFNNIAYHNGYKITSAGFGFIIQDTEQADAVERWRNYSNNIDYDNYRTYVYTAGGLAEYSGSNNTWDISLSLTDADFVSLDTTGITAPRQADGSLPDNNCYNNFLKLASTSKAINAGVNVGLPYNSSAPDLGPFEASGNETLPKLVTNIGVAGLGGISTIATNKGVLQLIATVLPSDATNKTVTWSIINGTGQASISSSGLVTAIANGTVTARATARDGSGVYGSLVITISNQVIGVSGITVSGAGGASTITTTGGSLQLSVAVLPANATDKTVTWSIVNGTGQASISSSGLVTAIANGTVTARATARDGSGVYGSLVITISNQVIGVSGITVSGAGGASTITTTGGSLQLSASVLPANATDKTVTWSIINGTGQASISSSGLVTAVTNGTVTARATARDGSGVYGSLIITISNQVIGVSGITVSGAGGASTITTTGGSLQLSASVLPANATDKTVTWSIINGTGQASILSLGLVTAVTNGTVTARATARDGSGVYGSRVITISNQNPETNLPPEVSISSPTKSISFISPATVTIEAIAYDPDGTISKVEFFNGTTKLGEKSIMPYDFTWKDVPEGSYSITAAATDNRNMRTVSDAVTVVVEKSVNAVNQQPVVNIIYPTNNNNSKDKKNYRKGDKIIIAAEASDPDGSISKVEFKNGSITLAEVTSVPYSFTWEPADTGTFVITAIATDNLGATSASSGIELNVGLYYDINSEIVNIYPNPNDGHFSIEAVSGLTENKNRVTIFNLAGQTIYDGILDYEERTKEIDISESTSGTYVIMITNGQNIVATKKVIKN